MGEKLGRLVPPDSANENVVVVAGTMSSSSLRSFSINMWYRVVLDARWAAAPSADLSAVSNAECIKIVATMILCRATFPSVQGKG